MGEEIIRPGRRVGNTTRQINREIDTLLSTGQVFIRDHAHKADVNGHPLNSAQRFHVKMFFDRLYQEHRLTKEKDYTYDDRTFIATLKKQVYEKMQAHSDQR